MEQKLYKLKMKILKSLSINDNLKEELANEIFQIEKELAINYNRCCTELRDEYLQPELDKYKNIKVELSEQYCECNKSSDSDLFQGEYNGKKIKIKEKFLKLGKEAELLQKLKKFNLGSGHEEMKLSKIDDDEFVFRLQTYMGGRIQVIYFERLK